MRSNDPLEPLFGSNSRVSLIRFFLDNPTQGFRVNEIIRKTRVNARLVSVELKNLAQIGILVPEKSGSNLVYKLEPQSYLSAPLREIFSPQEWSQWERPSRIHHLILTLEAGLKPMKEYYGHCLPYSHLVFNYDNVTWVFKPKDFLGAGKALIPVYLKRHKEIWSDFEKLAANLWGHKDYTSFHQAYVDFWMVAYITEPVSMYIDSLLRPGEHISIADRSFTEDYEDRLWQLATQAKKIGLQKVSVEPILLDYFWIRNSYHSIHRLTQEEVRTEILKRLNKKRPTPALPKDPISISRELVSVGKDMVFMQDQRKKIMMQAAYYLHEHLKKVGQKYGLSPTLMSQTVPNEALHINKDLEEELKLRLRACTITGDLKNGIKVYSGQTFFPAGAQQKALTEIRGSVACGGKAVGRAKLIGHTDDMYKVNHGDIIVSPMTSPDLMPAIRRCVAIVTDFGGITCHAAIIAREFNIPCIVGTGDATKIIRDDDLIEVDANNGVVKILKTSL